MQPKPTATLRRTGPNTAAVDYSGFKLPAGTAPASVLIEEIKTRELIEMDMLAATKALGWVKGQLLNVRNKGEYYAVTLLGEEEDPRYPERTLRFPNSARCQDFVSNWYTREHQDPRAF